MIILQYLLQTVVCTLITTKYFEIFVSSGPHFMTTRYLAPNSTFATIGKSQNFLTFPEGRYHDDARVNSKQEQMIAVSRQFPNICCTNLQALKSLQLLLVNRLYSDCVLMQATRHFS